MLIIETKYLGPTNTRGSRVKAKVIAGRFRGKSKTVPWRSELDMVDNHSETAKILGIGTGLIDGPTDIAIEATDNGYIIALW